MKKLLLAVMALSVLACTKHETQVVYQNPPADVLKSFSTDCTKKNCVKIDKDSLGKVFLLLVSGKTNGATPSWTDFKPLAVTFQKSGSQIAIFSLTLDAIYGAEDSKELIQTFQVLEESSDTVTFDWGRGFETLRDDGEFGSEILDPNQFRASLRIMDSYIHNISMTSDAIEIKQISKIQTTKFTEKLENPYDEKSEKTKALETTEETFNLNIQLIPYVENKNFQPKEADISRTVGFFVTSTGVPAYANQNRNLIMKWDFNGPKGPVRFLLSSNTPKDYVAAVREGILYWNKVLGFEAVVVETDVDVSTVPPLHSVMVRWIPWENAGFAYAGLQADPLTGETLRGQIFMTPAWLQGKGIGERLSPVLNPLVTCDFNRNEAGPLDYPDNPLDLRIAQDRVRGVIAHEVGHVVGLRHNFAASSSIHITAGQILQRLKEYLVDDKDAGELTSTTVMDYIRGADEVLLGKYIESQALPYDQMALKWAYSADDSGLDPKVSAYCSDEDYIVAAMKNKLVIYDCGVHDYASSQFLPLVNEQLYLRNRFLLAKYNEILKNLFPKGSPKFTQSLDVLLENNHVDLKLADLKKQVGYYRDSTTLVSLDKWKNVLQRNQTSSKDPALEQLLRKNLDEIGGFVHMKELLFPKTSGWSKTDLQSVLNLIVSGKGLTKEGRAYSLTLAQQDQLANYFKNEAQYIEAQLQKELNEVFQGF